MCDERILRPWGEFKIVETTHFFQTKIITLKPGKRLSLQSHEHRDEHWIVVSGLGTVQINDVIYPAQANSTFFVPRNNMHRLTNTGTTDLVVVEVQTGDYFGEDDIERIEDDFGRVAG